MPGGRSSAGVQLRVGRIRMPPGYGTGCQDLLPPSTASWVRTSGCPWWLGCRATAGPAAGTARRGTWGRQRMLARLGIRSSVRDLQDERVHDWGERGGEYTSQRSYA
ncbi:hypothetical protein GCM10010377_73870 [Streptomyces viridiviolaceus]|nr:hypothetical protein GCM10010377_73870 [Streptomyces viridiviolaceus]